MPAIHERAVDSNMFRVSHFTTCCLSPKSLLFFLLSFASNGEGERQQEQVEKERATEAEGRDAEGGWFVRHGTRTQSHFHKFSQVLRQLVPSNSRRTVSSFAFLPSYLLSILTSRALSVPPSLQATVASFFLLRFSYRKSSRLLSDEAASETFQRSTT